MAPTVGQEEEKMEREKDRERQRESERVERLPHLLLANH